MPTEILESKCTFQAKSPKGKVFLSMYELTVSKNGKTRPYFMVSRDTELVNHLDKKTDAVVIVGIHVGPFERRLVVINEFRPPIRTRELSFPAGLIDPADYSGSASYKDAAIAAAKRELKEETGLDVVEIVEVSPPNLYSSAGMTNESIVYVICTVEGELTTKNQEESEDIQPLLLNIESLDIMLNDECLAFSKTSWPFMRSFVKGQL